MYVSSVRMDDLECPCCLKQCDNRGNREKHVAACKKQRDTTQESQACPASHVRRTGQAAITTSWSAQLGARLLCGYSLEAHFTAKHQQQQQQQLEQRQPFIMGPKEQRHMDKVSKGVRAPC